MKVWAHVEPSRWSAEKAEESKQKVKNVIKCAWFSFCNHVSWDTQYISKNFLILSCFFIIFKRCKLYADMSIRFHMSWNFEITRWPFTETLQWVIAWQFVKRTWQRTPYSMDNTKNAYIKNFTYLKEIYAYFYKKNGKIDQKRLDYFFTKACNQLNYCVKVKPKAHL